MRAVVTNQNGDSHVRLSRAIVGAQGRRLGAALVGIEQRSSADRYWRRPVILIGRLWGNGVACSASSAVDLTGTALIWDSSKARTTPSPSFPW